jgi:hypothetical protein
VGERRAEREVAVRSGSKDVLLRLQRRPFVASRVPVRLASHAQLPGWAAGGPRDAPLVDAIEHASRSTPWTPVRRLPLDFQTYHPQGFARLGDRLFLSSVEVIEAPQRYPEPVGGYDRTPGRGRGHLFELSLDGRLLGHIELDEGTIYHPGGIDYDGESLWVPVAEYRPEQPRDRLSRRLQHAARGRGVPRRRPHRRRGPRPRQRRAARRLVGLAHVLQLDVPGQAARPHAEPRALRGLPGLRVRALPQGGVHRHHRVHRADRREVRTRRHRRREPRARHARRRGSRAALLDRRARRDAQPRRPRDRRHDAAHVRRARRPGGGRGHRTARAHARPDATAAARADASASSRGGSAVASPATAPRRRSARRQSPSWGLDAIAPILAYDSEIMGDISTGGTAPTTRSTAS